MTLAQTPEATATRVTKASVIGGTARARGAAPQSFTTRNGAISGREGLLLAPHFAGRHIEQAQGDGSSGGYSEDHGQLRDELRG